MTRHGTRLTEARNAAFPASMRLVPFHALRAQHACMPMSAFTSKKSRLFVNNYWRKYLLWTSLRNRTFEYGPLSKQIERVTGFKKLVALTYSDLARSVRKATFHARTAGKALEIFVLDLECPPPIDISAVITRHHRQGLASTV